MSIPAPHFLLYSETRDEEEQGKWMFVLRSDDGSATFKASDHEPTVAGERLELLAVVRGLEALAQPSRVTLITPSRYVNRVLAYGLDEWRTNGWTWESFGQMVPVKNADLWRRLDKALGIHQLDSHQMERREIRRDNPHKRPGPHFSARRKLSSLRTPAETSPESGPTVRGFSHTRHAGATPRSPAGQRAAIAQRATPERLSLVRRALAALGTCTKRCASFG